MSESSHDNSLELSIAAAVFGSCSLVSFSLVLMFQIASGRARHSRCSVTKPVSGMTTVVPWRDARPWPFRLRRANSEYNLIPTEDHNQPIFCVPETGGRAIRPQLTAGTEEKSDGVSRLHTVPAITARTALHYTVNQRTSAHGKSDRDWT
ncbi:hypothetical protein OH76DRAFT_1404568 [Lentinus brumalis]|uniref:Uncharacterized protein n=1 Tax=Lentinus brumalis TaxID=2498619 RepID=A0A371D7X8_9APHY|nr:hypothetical protein OH76DRAFT_1404568 [Polyporus brumalis]